jgi:hypothetical protein
MAIQINHCKINEDTKQIKFITVSCVPVSHTNFLVFEFGGFTTNSSQNSRTSFTMSDSLSVKVIYIRGAQNTHTHTHKTYQLLCI